ncbi:general transcription factor II-I repeat domain-containing protein 2A [Trichonephila clavipes]|nr:general transcription factor II-I repeat domain-containing protein 2A [Trichonephila clavipes]
MDSLIKEFSARFSQFKELSETFEFIMYPDVISFDKLNLSQFDWLEIEGLEMQMIDFQSSSIWIQKFIETRKKLELIEAERLTSNISKNTSSINGQMWLAIYPDIMPYPKFEEYQNIGKIMQEKVPKDGSEYCLVDCSRIVQQYDHKGVQDLLNGMLDYQPTPDEHQLCPKPKH